MTNLIKHYRLITLVLAITVSFLVIKQSLFQRWFGYETIPIPITDEFDYAWQGISLYRYGLPLGWTILNDNYTNPKLNPRRGSLTGFAISIDGKIIDLNQFKVNPRPLVAIDQIDYMKGPEHMFFVAPFFDHPPLGGLIYSLGVNQSVNTVDQVKPSAFRQPALILAVITSVLLFILLSLITNPWVGALSVIVYSTVPTYLLATWMSFLENAVVPFILTHLIFLNFLVKDRKRGYLWAILAGLMGGFGVLAKESAVGFLLGSLILLLIHKLPKKIIYIFIFSLSLPVIAYLTWGFWLQGQLFLSILVTNSNRTYFGALKLASMLEALKFKNFPIDGWWIWGFISFMFISFHPKSKDQLFVTLPLLTHLLLVLLLGSNNSPWYLISCIPLLAACSGIFIWHLFIDPTLATALAFFLIPFSSSYYWGRVALNLQPDINHYRYSFIVFLIFLSLRIFSKHRIFHYIWILFLTVIVYKIVVFNQVFFPYLIANWGNLPIPSLPNY